MRIKYPTIKGARTLCCVSSAALVTNVCRRNWPMLILVRCFCLAGEGDLCGVVRAHFEVRDLELHPKGAQITTETSQPSSSSQYQEWVFWKRVDVY